MIYFYCQTNGVVPRNFSVCLVSWTPYESFQQQPSLQIVYSENFGTKFYMIFFYLGVCIAINLMSIFSAHLSALSIRHKQLVVRLDLGEVSNMIDGVFTSLPILPLPHGLSGIARGDKSDERPVRSLIEVTRNALRNRDNAKGINNDNDIKL